MMVKELNKMSYEEMFKFYTEADESTQESLYNILWDLNNGLTRKAEEMLWKVTHHDDY